MTWQSEGFAYADFFDEKRKRFVGLRTATIDSVVADGRSLVVKPDAAIRQQTADSATVPGNGHSGATTGSGTTPAPAAGGGAAPSNGEPAPAGSTAPTRFFGVVEVDATRLGRDAGRIAQEVLAHLTGLKDANVAVTVEIQAEVPDGVDEPTVRTVTENCRVLRFKSHGFEER